MKSAKEWVGDGFRLGALAPLFPRDERLESWVLSIQRDAMEAVIESIDECPFCLIACEIDIDEILKGAGGE